jgi:hypothetical protein
VNATAVAIGGKSATVVFKDVNTLSFIVPVLAPGPQQITLTNPDGETISLEAALIAN